MTKCVIFDIDGTLSDPTHRLHYIKNGKSDWEGFFKDCASDPIHEPIAWLLQTVQQDVPVLLVSGRPDSTREVTEAWMKEHSVNYNLLYMRPSGDYRPDDIIKREILAHIRADGWDPILSVDDRDRVVKMWREEGVTCLQCREWEEHYRENEDGLLTLMVGPSGAGKDYWLFDQSPINSYEKYGNSYHGVVSSDRVRAELCDGDFKDQTKNAQVFSFIHDFVKARIKNGLDALINATNIKNKDRVSLVKLSNGPVQYIVINRSLEDKIRDGGWRNELSFPLIRRHEQTFKSNLKDILNGDGFSNVTVHDLREYKE